MDREEMDKKSDEVRARMKAQRVLDITKGLSKYDLLPEARIDAIRDDMLNWDNEQLESMERFIDMAVEHAEMKKQLHEAKIELQQERTAGEKIFEREMKMVADLGDKKEHLKEVVDVIKGHKPAIELSPEETQILMNADDEDIPKLLEKMAFDFAAQSEHISTEGYDFSTKEGREAFRNEMKRNMPELDMLEDDVDKTIAEQAHTLAHAMLRAHLITDESLDQQIEEIKKWEPEALDSMWRMVDKALKPTPEPQVKPRKWGPGSDIATAHHERQQGSLADALRTLRKYAHDTDKEVVVDEPNPRRSIKEAFEEVNERPSTPLTLKPYQKRGSIKDRKEEADKKTTQEPKFVRELRKARELLESYDDTYADAYVEAVKANEAMLYEESNYDGNRLHEDVSTLRELVKHQMKTQRDLAVIDKVYSQALKKFEQIDVTQASVEELEQALRNYQSQDAHTDLDALFGGKYKTGDEPYHKWLAKKKKFLSAEEAAEMFSDMVRSFPDEVTEAFRKDKRSAGAVAPHTHADQNKMY